jgi:hypothetical protein
MGWPVDVDASARAELAHRRVRNDRPPREQAGHANRQPIVTARAIHRRSRTSGRGEQRAAGIPPPEREWSESVARA